MIGHILKAGGITGRSVLLLPFVYLGQRISVVSSFVFTHDSTKTERSQNDKNNKMREAIISAIINNRVPPTYYLTERWRNLKYAVVEFLKKCSCSSTGTGTEGVYSQVECIPAAGRGHNYDFTIVFTNNEGVSTNHHVEFKFNAAKVSDTPQFVSPMKPSQYLSGSYEEYFYDKFMPIIASMAAVGDNSANATNTSLPDRTEWLKQIHNNAPACVKHLQDKYYAGCSVSSQFTNDANDIAFYDTCKKLSSESIREFITLHDLDIVKLSEYLRESQDGKTYMLFQAASGSSFTPSITLQRVNPADYTIVSCIKNPEKSRYECATESGKKIHVLLRWKNGNGIAFPAFQIS
jgi:hypothetical protein